VTTDILEPAELVQSLVCTVSLLSYFFHSRHGVAVSRSLRYTREAKRLAAAHRHPSVGERL